MKVRVAIVLGLAAACLSGPARGAEVGGARFAEQMEVGGAELSLHGVGLMRYRSLFNGYAAALYLDGSVAEEPTSVSVLADVPRRLEIEYFWSIPAEKLAEATLDGVARNTDPRTFEALRERVGRLNRLYRDIEAGDRYALTYLPGVGTELAHNGRRLGVIEGADFSAALFAIWLGEQPLDESLRRQLLSRF